LHWSADSDIRQGIGGPRFINLSRRWSPIIAAALSVAVVAGCGGGSSSSSSGSTSAASTVQISTRNIPGLGPVLVNGEGRTLYMFVPDHKSKVTCTGSCAEVWPPVLIPGGQQATASGQAKSSLLGSDPDPEGGQVVTYAGWPLYAYVSDTAPGSAKGQALNLNGGLWYALSPSGKVIRKRP
jgi:predicted lipoprotein with Yx(FWY)xxD motif